MSGRLLTGLLTDVFGWRPALAIIGILSIVLSYLFWRFLPAPRHSSERHAGVKAACKEYGAVLHRKRPLLLISLGFILMGSFVTLYNYIGFHLMAAPYHLSQTVIRFYFYCLSRGNVQLGLYGEKADLSEARK